jgi:hypothetical protein
MTQQSLRRVIILVARIYLAHDVVSNLAERDGSTLSGFNVETYPILKRGAFDVLETRLQRMCESSSSVSENPKSVIELLQSIQSVTFVLRSSFWRQQTVQQLPKALESAKRNEIHYLEMEVEARVDKRVGSLLEYAAKKSKKQKM